MLPVPTARRSVKQTTGLTLGEIADWLGGDAHLGLICVETSTPYTRTTEYHLSLTPEQYRDILRFAGLPSV